MFVISSTTIPYHLIYMFMANSTIHPSQFPSGYLKESRQVIIIASCLLFIGVNTVAVALRFVARRIGQVGCWHRDDVLVVIGYVFCTILDVLCISMYYHTNKVD